MAKWQNTLDLADVWDKVDTQEISIQELAGVIAKRLKKIKRNIPEDLLEDKHFIVEDFIDLSKNEAATDEDFNEVMTYLYDWADTPLDDEWNGKKVCWINTF
jgi:hypothetical protein